MPPVIQAVVIVAGVLFFAVSGSACHVATTQAASTVAAPRALADAQLVAATPARLAAARIGPDPDLAMPASRWRVVTQEALPRPLPAGLAPERGLQVATILASRAISAAFPEIHNIGGVRADALPWHPNGLALDVMIPDPSSAAGIALGNEILAFAMKNAERFALQDVIWRGTYYTPSGPHGSGNGHYDHVHITTHGRGYPTGGEVYLR